MGKKKILLISHASNQNDQASLYELHFRSEIEKQGGEVITIHCDTDDSSKFIEQKEGGMYIRCGGHEAEVGNAIAGFNERYRGVFQKSFEYEQERIRRNKSDLQIEEKPSGTYVHYPERAINLDEVDGVVLLNQDPPKEIQKAALKLLQTVEAHGAVPLNSSESLQISGDKGIYREHAIPLGVPMACGVTLSMEEARDPEKCSQALDRVSAGTSHEGFVIKDVFGSGSRRGVRLVNSKSEALDAITELAESGNDIVIEERIPLPIGYYPGRVEDRHALRILVQRDDDGNAEVIGVVGQQLLRSGGIEGIPIEQLILPQQRDAAILAARAGGQYIGGVDIMGPPDAPVVAETNGAVPFFPFAESQQTLPKVVKGLFARIDRKKEREQDTQTALVEPSGESSRIYGQHTQKAATRDNGPRKLG